MKTNYKLRRRYQGWRILDHFLGRDLPATNYLSQRDRTLQMFLSKKEKIVIENKTLQVDRIVDISEKDLKQNYINRGIPVVMEGKAKNWKCVKQWSLDWLSENYSKDEVAIFDPLNAKNDSIDYSVEKTTLKDVIESIKLGDTNKYSRFNRILYDHPELIDDFDWKWLYNMRNKILLERLFKYLLVVKDQKPLYIVQQKTISSLKCLAKNIGIYILQKMTFF